MVFMGILGSESRRVVAAICGRNISRTFLAKKRGVFPSPTSNCVSPSATHSSTAMFSPSPPHLFSWPPAHTAGGRWRWLRRKFWGFSRLSPLVYTFREHCFDCTCMYTYWVSLWHFGPCAAVWAPGQIARGASLFFLPQLGSEDGTSAQSPSPTLKDITD